MINYKEKVRAIKFARKFIETGGNSTQAYKAINPKVKITTAMSEGYKELVKPSVKKSITELLPSDKKEASIILQALDAKPKEKEITWSDKHQYLTTSLKLKGYLKDKDTGSSTNIAIIIGDRIK